MGWIYELYFTWKSNIGFNEGRGIDKTLENVLNNIKHFDYVKPDEKEEENNASTKDHHEDMISNVLIIKPRVLAKGEGKYKLTHKIVTAG